MQVNLQHLTPSSKRSRFGPQAGQGASARASETASHPPGEANSCVATRTVHVRRDHFPASVIARPTSPAADSGLAQQFDAVGEC